MDRAARGESVEIPWSAFGEADDPDDRMDQDALWDYDAFTRDLARQLQPWVEEGGASDFFTRFYAGEHEAAWSLLHRPSTEGTKLRSLYDAELRRLARRPHLAVGFGLEAWEPDGKLGRLGTHPGLALLADGRLHPWRLGLDVALRFLDTPRPYVVGAGPDATRTEHFQWAELMLVGGRRVFTAGAVAADLLAGGGWAELQYRPVPEFAGDPQDEAWIGSVTGMVGLELRRPLGGLGDLNLQIRRQWVDLDTDGGSVLRGGAWTLRLGWQHRLDGDADRRRRALGAPAP
jgi:hypothetical protein